VWSSGGTTRLVDLFTRRIKRRHQLFVEILARQWTAEKRTG
jgi:hypothetical protein